MVKELLDSITTNVKIIDVQAQHLTEVEYDWGEEEEFYLQDFIEDYISNHKSTQFSYLFINDNRVWMKGRYDDISEYWHGEVVPNRKLRMPKNALRQVFDNIVSNAVSHGFTQQGRRYIIDFDFEYEFENIVLEISNNGEPMLEGVNTEYVRTYGSSTKLNVIEEDKKTVHSGIGGYDIYNILKKFNAEFEVVSTPDSEWTVCYRIIFHDVLNSNYIIDIDE